MKNIRKSKRKKNEIREKKEKKKLTEQYTLHQLNNAISKWKDTTVQLQKESKMTYLGF